MFQTQRPGLALVAGQYASTRCAAELTAAEACFAVQIATAVWLGRLTDAAAREAMLSYALACQCCEGTPAAWLREALESEYRRCRQRQDLVS